MASEQDLQRGRLQAKENATVNVALTPLEQPKFTNLKLQRDIILNDFVFNTIDDYGVVWVVTDIDGWWTPPAPEIPDIPRGFGDGSYDVQGRYLARTFTLSGVFLTPDPSMVEDARDRLTQAIDLVYKGAWLLTGSDPIRASFVRLTGQPTFQTVNARGRTEFEIELRAPDPIKYSWNDAQPDGYDFMEISGFNYSVPGSGSEIVTNVGNYNVPCILEVSGPIVGPATIYNKTTDELIIVLESFGGALSAQVEAKQLSFDESKLLDMATLTTKGPHKFSVGQDIYVSGVGEPFDGDYTIESVPTETTLTYARLPEIAIIRDVAYKSLEDGVATLETVEDHGISVGQTVLVSRVDSVFNGTHVVDSVPSPNKITFSASRVPEAIVIGRRLVSNIATLTTSAPHGFIVGEEVVITGVDSVNYNGTYTITAVSSDGLQFSYARTRTDSRSITNTSLTNTVATITTSEPHGFVSGERAAVSGVNSSYDGTYVIESVPTDKTFTYTRTRDSELSVIAKSASNSTATLTTSSAHNFASGDQVFVRGVDATFNGTYTITSVLSENSFSYYKPAADVPPTPVSGGFASVNGRWVLRKRIVGNVATLTTLGSHGILVGESVTVANVGPSFDGTFVVTAVTSNTFSYVKTSVNISDSPAGFVISKIRRVDPVAATALKDAQTAVSTANQGIQTALEGRETDLETLRDLEKTAETAKGTAEAALTDAESKLSTARTNLQNANKRLSDAIEAQQKAQVEFNKVKDKPQNDPDRIKAAKDLAEANKELDLATRAVANRTAQRDAALAARNAAQTEVNNKTTAYNTAVANREAAEEVDPEDDPDVIAATTAKNSADSALQAAQAAALIAGGSTATAITTSPHGFTSGDKVYIGGISDQSFNGYYTIDVVDTTTFTYITETTGTVATVNEETGELEPIDAGDGAYVVKGKTTYSGNIASATVTSGTVEVSGSLPFVSTSGKATVSENITKTLSSTGAVIKKNDIQFTPGVQNGSVSISADILEINTQDREVAFNGELLGARAKIDVLADFIKLAPGNNIIEFRDNGNPESGASLKVFYRSGWLS